MILLALLLAGFDELVHVLNGGFVDDGLLAAADFDGVAVVPLDAAFDFFAVFEHDDHRGLGLNLFLQVEELGVMVLVFVVSRKGREMGGDWNRRKLARARFGVAAKGRVGCANGGEGRRSTARRMRGERGRTGGTYHGESSFPRK